jgi:Glycosyltransferase family 87
MRSRAQSIGPRVRESAAAWAAATLGILIVAWLALYGWAWTDYDDEARPAFDALFSGHLLHFLQLAPSYGGSLVLRSPFVLIPKLWGGGELAIYRAAAAPCLAASAIFGVWLVARMRTLGRSTAARAFALFLCVANPITLPALELGHPEELLGAVLCVAAVLLAMRDRPIWAGVLLGLAVANKEWAIVATGPVLLALPRRQLRALAVAGAVAGAVLAPLVVAGSAGFLAAKLTAVKTGVIFQPWQAWWFLGSHGHVVRGLYGNIKVGYRTPPGWIESVGHPLIVVITLPLTLLCIRLRRRGSWRPAEDALLLLALLLLLRCILDPWDISYYSLPFLFALLAWETLKYKRVPAVSLAASFGAWFVFQATSTSVHVSADMQSAIFLAAALPAVSAIAVALYAPGLRERLSFWPRRRAVMRGHASPNRRRSERPPLKRGLPGVDT